MTLLGEIVRQYRYSQNPRVTLDELSKASGLSKSYLSMIENDKFPRGENIRPTDLTIGKLAKAMGMSITALVDMIDDDYPVIDSISELDITKEECNLLAIYRKLPLEAQNLAYRQIRAIYDIYYLQKGGKNL